MRRRTSRFVLAATAALISASTARSQKLPQFGVTSELVMIDLVATDRDGRLVRDLRGEEILVFEQGKPRPLEFLRLVEARGAAAPRGTVVPSANLVVPPTGEARSGEAANTDSAPALVVVVDVYTTPAESLTLTRQAIISMVREQVEKGTRLMLVAIDRGIQIRQPFTEDIGVFTAAVEGLKPSPGNNQASLAGLVEDVNRSCDGTPGGGENARTQAKIYLEIAKRATMVALEGLAALNRHLASTPGRKQMVFYSPGHAMRPSAMLAEIVDSACSTGPAGLGASLGSYTALGGNDVDSTPLLRAVVDEANLAQVSLYTVDARGLGGPGAEAVPSAAVAVTTRTVSGGRLPRVQRASQNAPQEILRSLAEGTGGVASMNTNELGRGFTAAIADSRGHYLLAYAPPVARERGRFYEIELKTSRPGVSLRYRRGYQWLSDEDRAERALTHAILFPGLHAADGLAVETRIDGGSLHITTRLPTRSLVFREEAGRFRNEIELQGVLRDEKGKTVGKRFFFARNVAMNLSFDRREEILADESLEIVSESAPPGKGRYQLTVVARHSGGRLASASAEVEVP